MDDDSDPTATTGEGYHAKIWLLELNQTWDNTSGIDICGLPCTDVIPTEVEAVPSTITSWTNSTCEFAFGNRCDE